MRMTGEAGTHVGIRLLSRREMNQGVAITGIKRESDRENFAQANNFAGMAYSTPT